jgi:hypothetical protein
MLKVPAGDQMPKRTMFIGPDMDRIRERFAAEYRK